MRMEDLDVARARPEYEKAILESLAWLGIEWDGEVEHQQKDVARFREAIEQLARQGRVFRCDRTRREIRDAAEARGAPHGEGSAHVSTVAMRPQDQEQFTFTPGTHNHRFVIDATTTMSVHDALLGENTIDVSQVFGDPIVWTRENIPAYQLAVVVDDLAQGITDVVRGADLLVSAAVQTQIAQALGGTPPRWWHLPLVLDTDGRRLAKRDGDLSIEALRASGVAVERVVGLLATSCGLQSRREPMTSKALLEYVSCAELTDWACQSVANGGDRLTEEDLAWLTSKP